MLFQPSHFLAIDSSDLSIDHWMVELRAIHGKLPNISTANSFANLEYGNMQQNLWWLKACSFCPIIPYQRIPNQSMGTFLIAVVSDNRVHLGHLSVTHQPIQCSKRPRRDCWVVLSWTSALQIVLKELRKEQTHPSPNSLLSTAQVEFVKAEFQRRVHLTKVHWIVSWYFMYLCV